jgi:hypothetical protein
MDRADVDGLMRGVGAVLKERLGPIEARLKALEERRTMSFEGAHDAGRQYRPGDVVQRAAGLYVCLAATNELPGDSAYWRRIGDAR